VRALPLLFLVGCTGVDGGQPVRPIYEDPLIKSLEKKYKDPAAFSPTDEIGRNVIIDDLIFLVDRSYYQFEADVYKGGATFSTVTDTILIALGGVGSLIAAPEVKSILAATSAGVSGIRASVSKNFLQEQTIHAIISKMRAGRVSQLVEMRQKRSQPLIQYTLAQGLSDVEEYFNRGTLVGALRSIVVEAGADLERAEATLRTQ